MLILLLQVLAHFGGKNEMGLGLLLPVLEDRQRAGWHREQISRRRIPRRLRRAAHDRTRLRQRHRGFPAHHRRIGTAGCRGHAAKGRGKVASVSYRLSSRRSSEITLRVIIEYSGDQERPCASAQ
jgi:hypothetical protein